MNEVMLRDIRDQPAALKMGLRDLRRQVDGLDFDSAPRRLILTGSGDSLIASIAVEALLSSRVAAEVRALPALDASRYVTWGPGDVAVCVSVSGEVSRAIEAAERARAAGASAVAVTAGPDSSLTKATQHTVLMPPPIDRSIPHSRDYTMTLAALAVIGERMSGEPWGELDVWLGEIDPILSRAFDACNDIPLAGGRTWFLGAGPDRATAMYGALKFWEAGGLLAWWDDLEEFGHGSQLMTEPGDRAVLITAEPGLGRALEMLPGLQKMGLESVLVSPAPRSEVTFSLPTHALVDSAWHPFISCLPLQVLSYVEATARSIDVSVPLFGRDHGPAFDEVHVEWTKHSRILRPDAETESPGH